VSVALVIQNTVRMRHIILSSVTCPVLQHFSALSHKRHDFRGGGGGSFWIQNVSQILTFCWPCISVYLSQYLTNLMNKICFTISFISCLHMFRAHVLIIRRSKLHYTASGIITPTECDDTRGCVMQFWPPDDEHMCSKHVEAWNKTYCETNFVHQVG